MPDTDSPATPATAAGAVPVGPPSDATTIRRRRLLFRASHRGTQENDLLIGGFVRARMDVITEAEMDALEMLMELPDVDLADWLTGRRPIPAAVDCPMLQALRAAALSRP